MLRMLISRIAVFIGAVAFWTWAALNFTLNLVGKSTVVDDFNLLVGRLPDIVRWLYSTPWWVPAILAAILTAFLIWLSWPRQVPAQPSQMQGNVLKQPAQRPLPRQPAQTPAATSAPPSLPLTAHAVQRKLVAIDQAREWLEKARTLFDRWQALLQENWQASVSGQKHPEYAGKINDFIRDFKRFATEIDDFRAERSEYQDISIALQQLYYNKAREELAEYSAACEAQWQILNAGLPQNTARRFLAPAFNGFEEALKSANAWRTQVKNTLNDIQKEISPI